MPTSKKLICWSALPFLVACGGATEQQTDVFAADVPTTADGTLNDVLSLKGARGHVAKLNGRVIDIHIRTEGAEDDLVYYVTIDGEGEIAFRQTDSTENRYFDDDDRELFLSSFPSGESSTLTIRDRATGDDIRGNFGLRTAILPDEELYYRGSWSASNREGPVRDLYMDGGLSFYVNFTTGDVTGVSNVASIEYSDDGGETYDITSGSVLVDGRLLGAEIDGTLTVSGAAAGLLNLAGAIYGPNAEEALGVIGGTVIYDGMEIDVGGRFETEEALAPPPEGTPPPPTPAPK